MQSEYDDINRPEELLNFMVQNFNYGYLSNDGNLHYPSDSDFDSSWFTTYILQSNEDLLKSKVGNCFDAVEFERSWFKKHNYEFVTIFEMVKLNYFNNYPMHTFLIYKSDNKWHYFEWADGSNQGIFSFTSLFDAVAYQYKHYLGVLDNLNVKSEEKNKVIRYVYDKLATRCNAVEYLKFVVKGKVLESGELE